MSQPGKTLLVWGILILGFLAVWQVLYSEGGQRQPAPFSDFLQLVDQTLDMSEERVRDRRLESIHVDGDEIQFTIVDSARPNHIERGVTIGRFDEPERLSQLARAHVKIGIVHDSRVWPFWPNVITAGLVFLFAVELGVRRKRMRSKSPRRVKLSDVNAGQEAKAALLDVIAYLRRGCVKSDDREQPVPRTLLLAGPPGSGRSRLACAVAGEARAHLEHVRLRENVGFPSSVGCAVIEGAFERAVAATPSLLIIDDVDCLFGDIENPEDAADCEQETELEIIGILDRIIRETRLLGEKDRVVLIATSTNRYSVRLSSLFSRTIELPAVKKAKLWSNWR